MSDTESKHLIEVSLENGGTFILANIDDLETWFEAYKEDWCWTTNHQKNANTEIRQTASNITGFINTLSQYITNYKKNPQTVTSLQNHFKSQRMRGWINIDDPKIKFSLLESDEELKLVKLTYFISGFRAPASLYGKLYKAYVESVIYDGQNDQLKPSVKSSLTSLISKYETRISELVVEFDKQKSDWAKHLEKSIHDQSTRQKALTDLQNEKDVELTAYLEESTNQIESWKKAHREEINLKEPVSFWLGKQKSNFLSMIITSVIFFAGLFCSSIYLKEQSKDIYEGLKAGQNIEYWRIAAMLLIGGMVFWALRLISRFLMSQIHGWLDAQERVVMVRTYLSLLQEDKALQGDQRRLILEALFRPAPTGIIKDDGVPPAVFDLITRMK